MTRLNRVKSAIRGTPNQPVAEAVLGATPLGCHSSVNGGGKLGLRQLSLFDEQEYLKSIPVNEAEQAGTELSGKFDSPNRVVSKERVAAHGEVFTSEREVKAMLDLVKNETERIDSRFLEPACGTGNFLVEVLARRLRIVKKRYCKSQALYGQNALLALACLYGIDILADSVAHCRERLFELFESEVRGLFKSKADGKVLRSARFLLDTNIVHGDALSMKLVGSDEGICFTQWSLIEGTGKFKGIEFRYSELQAPDERDSLLFSQSIHPSDSGKNVFIAQAVRDFPLTDYTKLYAIHNPSQPFSHR